MTEGGDSAARFFAGFYKDPDARLAADALAHVLADPVAPKNSVLRMFVRVAQLSTAVQAEYRALGDRQPAIAATVTSLLAAAADPSLVDAARLELRRPEDLDIQWSEFLLTGSEAPVRRIVAVLAWEDRVRAALGAWVNARVYLPWAKSARTRTVAALAHRGVALDSQVDLDLVVWKLMSGGFQVRSELPFPVSDDLLAHMVMKGAACWSVQSNALSHPIVRGIYEAVVGSDRHPRFIG